MIKIYPWVRLRIMDVIYFNEGIDIVHEHDRRVDLDNFPEIKEELEKQELYLSKYKLQDKDMIDYVYKDGNYVGTGYIFSNKYSRIKGRIYVVFEFSTDFDEQKNFIGKPVCAYYVFRTWVSFHGTSDEYNRFCTDMMKLSEKFQLTLVSTIIEHGIGLPKNPFLEPVFYEKVERFDIDSFIDFMNKIEKISDIYPLYCTQTNR